MMLPGLRTEPVHPGPDQPLQHLGDLRGCGTSEAPGGLVLYQGASLDQRGEPFL